MTWAGSRNTIWTRILNDFVEWIESAGGIPAGLPDAAADMRAAGVSAERNQLASCVETHFQQR